MRQHFGSLFGSRVKTRMRMKRRRMWTRRRRENRQDASISTPSTDASAVVYLLLLVVVLLKLIILNRQAVPTLQRDHHQQQKKPFHKQTPLVLWLPRSFNKVCRRLGIKISCELALIFYLFLFVCSPQYVSISHTCFISFFFSLSLSFAVFLRATSNQFRII